MFLDDSTDAEWDEAMHACCAAAEAKLPRIEDNPNGEARRHSLAARPVLGQLSASINEQGHMAQPQNAQNPVPLLAGGFNRHPMLQRPELCQQQQQQQHPQAQQEAQGAQMFPAVSGWSADNIQPSLSLADVHPVQQASAERQTTLLPSLQPSAAVIQNQPRQSVPATHSFPQHSRLDLDVNHARTGQKLAAARAQGPNSQLHTRPHHSSLSIFQEIQSRARHFAKQMHLLPQLAPRHSSCPGVYSGQGCGAKLKWVQFREGGGCWGCSSWPACDYKEAVLERLATPQVTLEAVSKDVFKVEAATGGQDVVRFCGGLKAILAAAGIPLGRALADSEQPKPTANESSLQVGKTAVTAANMGNSVQLSGQHEHSQQQQSAVGHGSLVSIKEGHAVFEDAQQQLAAALKDQVFFSFADYDDICQRLQSRQLQPSLLGSSALIPYATLASLRGGSRRTSEAEAEERFNSMPQHLRQALMPFQQVGVHFALRCQGRVLLADEMGVGKTVQAIAMASCYREEWPLLIIVPASLRLVWAEELEKWLPHLRPSSIHVIEGKSDRLQGSDLPAVCITSYEMMQRLTCDACKGTGSQPVVLDACAGSQHCLASKGWKIIIADESHTLRTSEKPPDARHTEDAVSAGRRSCRAIFLTGTPSLSRPFDLFRQVDALRPGMLGKDRMAFSYRYCNRRLIPVGRHGSNTKKYDNSGLSRAGELHALLKEDVMLRRLKHDVMAELPPKRRQVVRLPHPKPADWPDQELAEDAEDSDSQPEQDDPGSSTRPRGSDAMSKSHRTGLAKLPHGLEWLLNAVGGARRGSNSTNTPADDAEPAPKFLIFAHHKDVMSKLANALEGNQAKDGWAGVPYVRIDGETDSRDRRTACLRFKEDPAIRVALLSITAAGTGLDFNAASAVVFVELPQEVALVRQAEDRAHRHGQKLSVNVYFLVAKGTSDERRWQALSRSLERVTAVHGDEGDDQHGLKVHEVHDMQPGKPNNAHLSNSLVADTSISGSPQHAARVLEVHDRQLGEPGNINHSGSLIVDTSISGSHQRQLAGTPDTAAGTLGAAAGALDTAARALTTKAPEASGNTPRSGTAADPVNMEQSSSTYPAAAAAVVAAAAACDEPIIDLCIPAKSKQHDTQPQHDQQEPPQAQEPPQSQVHSLSRPVPGSVSQDALADHFPELRADCANFVSLSQAGKASLALMHDLRPAGERDDQPTQPADAINHKDAAHQPHCFSAIALTDAHLAAVTVNADSQQPQQQLDADKQLPQDSAPNQPSSPTLGKVSTELCKAEDQAEPLHGDSRVLTNAQTGQKPCGLHARMKALLRRQEGNDISAGAGDSDKAQPLTQAEVIEAQTTDEEKPLVWFEVSAHTSRVHFHGSDDGTALLGLSMPMGMLQGTTLSASLQDLLHALETRTADSVHVGPAGVLALPAHITRPTLEAILAEAREFVAEWQEMRPVFQHRLFGQCLRAPLQDTIDEVQQQATAEGAFGRGTSRYLEQTRPDLQLPDGAAWTTVRVKYARFVNPVEYQQAFTAEGARLCICCLAPVTACSTRQTAVLDGAMDLFCGAECEGKFCTRSSGGALRRALFRLERGVCTMCRLDCHALVDKVRMIERGSHKCDERRRARILTYAPNFGRHGSKAYLDRLVKQAVEGNAWHADHIVAVYQGGGLCDLENLRTLCVICHQDVTKQQAKERATARRQVAGQGTLDRFLSPSQDKQIQKLLAKSSKDAAGKKNSHDPEQYKQGNIQVLPADSRRQKKHAGLDQPQGCAKRPSRQMKRLYPEDELAHDDIVDISQSPEAQAKPWSSLKDDDGDFQPVKRLKARAASKTLPKGKASKAPTGKGTSKAQDGPVISLQSFSYSKESGKQSKDNADLQVMVVTRMK